MPAPVVGLIACALTLAAALLGLRQQVDGIGVFWPAAGVITGLALVMRGRAATAAAIGVLVALALGNATQERTFVTAVVFMGGNLVQGVLVALVVRASDRAAVRLDTVAGVAVFIAACLVVTAGVGSVMAFGLRATGHASGDWLTVWLTWWRSHGVGILTVAPAVVVVFDYLRSGASPDGRPLRGALVAGVMAVAAWLLIGVARPGDGLSLVVTIAMLFPLLLAGALVKAPAWPAAGLVALALVTVWHVSMGQGLFAGRVATAQAFLVVASMWTLTFAALMAERERVLAALRDADRRKDEFLAMLAHELRNPLAPLANAATLIERLPVGDPRVNDQGRLVGRQVNHLSRLVNDLLDMSRVNQSKISLDRRPVPITQVIEHACEIARPHLLAREQMLEVDAASASLQVNGDAVRLAQVFGNLLNNASTYSDPGSPIHVRVAHEAGEAVIRIIDRGRGIEPDLLPHIFELFTQGGRGTDRAPGGLGIGLALVRSLVAMHGGRVVAASAGSGRGATFTVRLPALD